MKNTRLFITVDGKISFTLMLWVRESGVLECYYQVHHLMIHRICRDQMDNLTTIGGGDQEEKLQRGWSKKDVRRFVSPVATHRFFSYKNSSSNGVGIHEIPFPCFVILIFLKPIRIYHLLEKERIQDAYPKEMCIYRVLQRF